MRWAAMLAACWLAAPLMAQDDVRPIARPNPTVATPTQTDLAETQPLWAVRPLARETGVAPAEPSLRPVMRPVESLALSNGTMTRPQFQAGRGLAAFSSYAVPRSLRPSVRPASIEAAAATRRAEQLRGQVCSDPAIQGEVLGLVQGAGACGIDEGVRVKSVAGVTLSPRATMDCRTASALKSWVERGVLPTVGTEGGGVSSLRVVSHYACRTRNNQPGGRLSEHAFGRAVDIAGIRLRDGTEMTVLTDWNSPEDGAQLRQMWRAACGPFGTVLGPEANRFHRDHFHFDTARHRSGTFCR
ncbi:MAG: extensin family protein [Yoonia sp.]|uniref:extensin-like domain-containing protein n=1 Tax=Yoonia sp. TaxID=2212373 RepID=UPI00273EF7E5|nr:extensin family protein [Yoonia sp.]MDP5084094.1 extensin family protein [Yoonia sp.]